MEPYSNHSLSFLLINFLIKFDGISILDSRFCCPFWCHLSIDLVHPIKSLAFVLGYAIDRGDEATLFLNLVVSFQDFHQVGFFSNLQGLAMSFFPFRGDTDRNGNLFFFRYL